MTEPEDHTGPGRRIAQEARDWLVHLASGTISDDDLKRFKIWRTQSPRHRQAFERERAFWHQLGALDAGTASARPSLTPDARGGMNRRAVLAGGGAAVAAAALIAAPRLDVLLDADFSTSIGEQAEFTLPDGSIAALNTQSAIAVDFRPGLRLVRLLKGEAAFQAAPATNAPFRVAALEGNSDATGAAFAVKMQDAAATVTVSEGRVHVRAPAKPGDPAGGTRGVELAAHQQTVYAEGQPPRRPAQVDTETQLAWRRGRLIFDGLPFSNAIAELGRYVPERIVMAPGIKTDEPVSAVFSTRETLTAIDALAKTQGLTARRLPGLMIFIS